jgi:ABC-type phosphate/phosphonate transport system substrate-binding protein
MIVRLGRPRSLGAALLRHLDDHLGVGLEYRQDPAAISGGWEMKGQRFPASKPQPPRHGGFAARPEEKSQRLPDAVARKKGLTRSIPLAVAGLVAISAISAFAGDKGTSSRLLRIGIVRTLFHGVPEPVFLAAMKPFEILVERETGMPGEVCGFDDAMELAKQVTEHKVGLAVINGVELAWARQRYRSLQPLMLAVNQDRSLHAYVVVRSNKNVTGLGGLKGKAVAVPEQNRLHCSLYLERQCRLQKARDVERFFSSLTGTADAEAALERVVDGRADGTIVEDVAWERYAHRKPGRAKHLKIIEKSETFPAAAVIYAGGMFDRHSLERFRGRMLRAHENAFGRQLLTLWRLTSFEPVPADYPQMLAEILKLYPAPETHSIRVSKK